MTLAEKITMYKEKAQFVNDLSEVFRNNPKYHSVATIEYGVCSREVADHTYFEEWIIVHFVGGGMCPRRVTGNSNIANFQVISQLIDGGYYEEMCEYVEMLDHGFKFIDLN
jgi:hypothetical protein